MEDSVAAAFEGTDDSELDQTLELVRRAQDGETLAFHRLFERYYERVRLIIRLSMGDRLREYVESTDILQETMFAAFKGFNRFEMRDKGSFLHWLSRIAENQIKRAANHHHAQKRDRRRDRALEALCDAMSSGELRFEPADDATPVHEKLARREDVELVHECVRSLSEDRRKVFILRHYVFGESSWPRIADALSDTTPDAARMLCARAEAAVLTCFGAARGRGAD